MDLEAAAKAAAAAADVARRETLPRFRRVATEITADGSPVTAADRAAERAMRELLRGFDPDLGILGEEYGQEGSAERGWLLDPIDGTIAYSRGIPLFTTLIALIEEGEPVLGLIDVPGHERFVKNMVAGASSVDSFLLVVAAHDGVMPQTKEHIEILELPVGTPIERTAAVVAANLTAPLVFGLGYAFSSRLDEMEAGLGAAADWVLVIVVVAVIIVGIVFLVRRRRRDPVLCAMWFLAARGANALCEGTRPCSAAGLAAFGSRRRDRSASTRVPASAEPQRC